MNKLEECGMLIKQINDKLETAANNDLKSSSLTLSQMRYLIYLYESEPRMVPLKELEAVFEVKQPTVAGIVNRLIKKNLIIMEQSSEDTRAKVVAISAAGHKELEYARSCQIKTENQLLHPLNQEEEILFQEILKKVNEGLK